MTEINNTARVQPVYQQRARVLTPAAQGPTGGAAPVYGADSARFSQPIGGNGQTQEQYAQFVADTIAMLDSTDARQRFQAIINMTKMNPQEAVPLLEKATKNDNPQVVQLATRALDAMKQMPAAAAATPPAPPTPAAPTVPTPGAPAAPAAPTAQTPAAPAAPAAPAVPAAPQAATPTPAAPAVPAAPAAPPAPPVQTVQTVQAPPAPQAFAGETRDFNTLYEKLQYGSIEEAQQAAYEMSGLKDANRQNAVSALLNMIPATGFRRSDDVLVSSINALVAMGAKEAVPFLEALTVGTSSNEAVRNAARNGVAQLKGTPAPTTRDFNTLYEKLQYGSGAEAQQAAYEMSTLKDANRQNAVAALLNMIPATGFRRSDDVLVSSINALATMGAKEAIPFFEALAAGNSSSETVKAAARSGLSQLKGGTPGAPAPAAPATPAAPAQAATPAAPAPAIPAQPQQTQVPAAPATPAAPAVPAAPAQPNVPGFLRK